MINQDMTIRAATRRDIDVLLAIEQECYRFPWSRRQFVDELDNPIAALDVAVVDHQLAGYLCSWLICGELQIQNLATSPHYRRCGIGQALLTYVIERSQQQGLLAAWLEVRENNQAAINLYQACGFKLQGRRKKYYQDGEDALLLGRKFT
ncbi:ribosomal protein S18-alanine N-acetyltransferase [Pelovirga terrestris]|uniref:[Ribosomal protein bS18]-alanine N-acetyltransferase n=1 Tax=Pelovirga terrestris TaxID=2771352 RepID=A0A8J6QP51_9BACT|nr:ribosomal protein S18-alanine N-acetyltransferase [Pelovirga terrestris]MBD1399175.1 ribosomal protein S18-alanine N-acetyltransferase [Pelovirga terrestris]